MIFCSPLHLSARKSALMPKGKPAQNVTRPDWRSSLSTASPKMEMSPVTRHAWLVTLNLYRGWVSRQAGEKRHFTHGSTATWGTTWLVLLNARVSGNEADVSRCFSFGIYRAWVLTQEREKRVQRGGYHGRMISAGPDSSRQMIVLPSHHRFEA
jgi:hypothetical protein